MMIKKSIMALAIISASVSAYAGPVTIDFENVESFSSIGDYYSDYGISFGLDALAFKNDELAPFAFSNAPSPTNVMATNAGDAFLNAALGFTGSASFYYSSLAAGTVSIYSGLNGTGDVLGTFNLGANARSGCTDTDYCHFDNISVAFNGVAKSIGFGSVEPGSAIFDNVTVTAVPEPSTYAMMGLGLLGLGAVARRRRSV